MKTETDSFKLSVLDGLQLAYKITANSIYGSIGASTNTIYFKEIAACTTAVGRKMLYFAKDYVESHFPNAEAVYGDTDSIFINFHPCDDVTGQPLQGIDALKKSIALGIEAGNQIKPFLKHPHDLEYEKTFWPFILFSKKRYVGNKYETDIDHYTLSSMGIVLKRRDNAPLLKLIYGDVIHTILETKDIQLSLQKFRTHIQRCLEGKLSLDLLIITKSLKSHYENPEQIVHKVLADRIAERDPGNKPQPNDRIPYVYIETKGTVTLQGDRVEHPDYIRKMKLKPDYLFYITNQISNPICQLYALILEEFEQYKRPKDYYRTTRYKELWEHYEGNEEKIRKKIDAERMDDIYAIIIHPLIHRYLVQQKNRQNGNQEIRKWFQPTV